MNIKQYLDSTYLKTHDQAEVSEAENVAIAKSFIQEAIDEKFKLIVIRPEMVVMAKKIITDVKSKVDIGTVIDFPDGKSTLEKKLEEANKAILDGADVLSFVCNYEAFIKGEIDLVKKEILTCTRFVLQHQKTINWIIEVAALNSQQIIRFSALIKNLVINNFKEEQYPSVFVKSSTGFYTAENNIAKEASRENIILMLENAFPLPVKAACSVQTYKEAVELIRLGVKRIGTSSAKAIADSEISKSDY